MLKKYFYLPFTQIHMDRINFEHFKQYHKRNAKHHFNTLANRM